MSIHRTIAVVTGSRAEYGLLRWLMQGIEEEAGLELMLVATGSHLAPEFGSTWKEIAADGFTIGHRVDMLVAGDSAAGVTKSLGLGVIGFAEVFSRQRPDVVVVLGDRFEILAVVQAAMLFNIPVAHLHGGELSEGAVDDAIRHAITKMAHLHFTAAEVYRRRVVQMGEQPDRVFNVGALGLDSIARLDQVDTDELLASLDIPAGEEPLILCTYHPATREPERVSSHAKALLDALEQLPKARIVFTGTNADAGGRAINEQLQDFVERNHTRARLFANLGQIRYLSLLRAAAAVVGNSSSGILEAPAIGTPTVNIGSRQDGRLRCASVIDCVEDAASIREALTRAISTDFHASIAQMDYLFGRGGASKKIIQTLKSVPLDSLRAKTFYDLPEYGS